MVIVVNNVYCVMILWVSYNFYVFDKLVLVVLRVNYKLKKVINKKYGLNLIG